MNLPQEEPYCYECEDGHRFAREHYSTDGCPKYLGWSDELDRRGNRLRKQCGARYKRVYWQLGYDSVDGTYPLEDGTWATIRGECEEGRQECGWCDTCRGRISAEEALALMGVEIHPGDRPLFDSGRRYLFLNKGFLVLGPKGGLHPNGKATRKSAMCLAMLEVLDSPDQGSAWPVGTRAIYVADGCYSQIVKAK